MYFFFTLKMVLNSVFLYNSSKNPCLGNILLHLWPEMLSAKQIAVFTACVRYFLSNFYFPPHDSPSKTMKIFFISSKKLFSYSSYSNFCISIFPSFYPVSHCFRGWLKINLKVYDVINCLNKNLIIYIYDILRRKKGMRLKLYPFIEY